MTRSITGERNLLPREDNTCNTQTAKSQHGASPGYLGRPSGLGGRRYRAVHRYHHSQTRRHRHSVAASHCAIVHGGGLARRCHVYTPRALA